MPFFVAVRPLDETGFSAEMIDPAMMVDLQKKYNWVLDTLIERLKPHIIDPAIRKRDGLRLIKAKEPTIISGRELRDKKE